MRDLADIRIVRAPNEIKRESGPCRLDVTLDVSGADLGSVARGGEATVAQVPFAAGYHPRIMGEYTALMTSRQKLWTVGLACLVGVAPTGSVLSLG